MAGPAGIGGTRAVQVLLGGSAADQAAALRGRLGVTRRGPYRAAPVLRRGISSAGTRARLRGPVRERHRETSGGAAVPACRPLRALGTIGAGLPVLAGDARLTSGSRRTWGADRACRSRRTHRPCRASWPCRPRRTGSPRRTWDRLRDHLRGLLADRPGKRARPALCLDLRRQAGGLLRGGVQTLLRPGDRRRADGADRY